MGLQYKIENVERKLLDKVTCDRCGTEIKKMSEGGWNQFGTPYSIFHEPSFWQFFLLKQHWGYGSKRDGEVDEAVVCEPCYDEIFKDVKIAITKDGRFEGAERDYGIDTDSSINSDRAGT